MNKNLPTPTGRRQPSLTNAKRSDLCRRIRQRMAELEIEGIIRTCPSCPRRASLRVDRLVLWMEGMA